MADQAVTAITLDPNTWSGDVDLANGDGTSVASGDVAIITGFEHPEGAVIICSAAAQATATLKAGDYPFAPQAKLGDLATKTIPASDILVIRPGIDRFLHDDGSIQIAIATSAVIVTAYDGDSMRR